MKKQIFVLFALTTITAASFAGGGAVGSNYCCIQSGLDNQNGINHSGKSKYCVSNNAEEIPEISANVFEITKYQYKFQINLNQEKSKSIAITRPDGVVQTQPEGEAYIKDLFIGNFGAPIYQYFSKTAGGFTLDCAKIGQ